VKTVSTRITILKPVLLVIARTLVICFLLATLVACEYPNDAVVVENESSQTLVLVEEFGENRIERLTMQPGQGYQTRRECVEADFVVESAEAGEGLARRPGPFCQGEDPWVITDQLLTEGD